MAATSGNEGFEIVKTLLTISISLAVFLLPQYFQWRSAGGAIEKALYGDVENLEKVAYKVKNSRWDYRLWWIKKKRKDVIHALCLGWSLPIPDYTKVLILDALKYLKAKGYIRYKADNSNDNRDEVDIEIDEINKKFALFEREFDVIVFNERIKANELLKEKLTIKR